MSLGDKLIRIERWIQAYRIGEDEPADDIPLNISLDQLLNIIEAKDDDPELFDGYILDQYQIDKLNEFSERQIKPDFHSYWYVLVCTGAYNW